MFLPVILDLISRKISKSLLCSGLCLFGWVLRGLRSAEFFAENQSMIRRCSSLQVAGPESVRSAAPNLAYLRRLPVMRTTLRFLSFTSLVLLTVSCCKADGYGLVDSRAPGDLQEVTVNVFVTGKLKTKDKEKQTVEVPLGVNGRLRYDERIRDLEVDAAKVRSARHYHEATARIQVDTFTIEPRLSKRHLLLMSEVDEDQAKLFCPMGPLSREELDLVNVQANSLVLPSLLPQGEQQIGQSWSHEKQMLAKLLGIDTVRTSDVKSTFQRVAGEVAHITIGGDVSGTVQGVETKIKVSGEYQFDLAQQRMTAVELKLHEDREIGSAEPGFTVDAKLQLQMTRLDDPSRLSESALAGLPVAASPETLMLRFESSAGKFLLMHDRPWRVMVNNSKQAILRYIENGEFIAQCNLSRLPRKPKNRLPLASFQSDVQNSLGENFGAFVDSAEFDTDEGLHVLQVTAVGEASNLPVQWRYYHLSDKAGYRAACVVTMRAKLVEQYPQIAERLIASFQFREETDTPETAQELRSVLKK